MPNLASSKKRVRQDVKRRARNRWRLRIMRSAVKDVNEHLLHGEVKEAATALKHACKVLDRTAQKGVIHKNTAARTKSRLSQRVKAKALGA